MKFKDIPRMSVLKHMPPAVQSLQKHAPHYIRRLIEKTRAFPEVRTLEDLEPGSIKTLRGGYASALYSIETKENFVVAKLRSDGVEAEHEAIEAWNAHGVPVPTIRRKGILTGTKHLPQMKYLLMDFIANKKGDRALTGTAYLDKNPGRSRRVGQIMGRTLARMHRATSSRTFGEYADMTGSTAGPLKSWNSYLMGYLKLHRGYLQYIGLGRRLIQELTKKIRAMRFPAPGVYLHGDYSLRNVMVVSSNPLKIVVFDPNPLIGDPSWDVAVIFNNRDYRRKRYEWEPSNPEYRRIHRRDQRFFEGFWRSYRLASTEKIDHERIWISQLIQSIIHLQSEEGRHNPDKAEQELEIQVRREALFERFGRLNLTH